MGQKLGDDNIPKLVVASTTTATWGIVASTLTNFITVGIGYNDIITRTWSYIIDYPVGALTVHLYAENAGGGSYSATNAHGSATVAAVRLT